MCCFSWTRAELYNISLSSHLPARHFSSPVSVNQQNKVTLTSFQLYSDNKSPTSTQFNKSLCFGWLGCDAFELRLIWGWFWCCRLGPGIHPQSSILWVSTLLKVCIQGKVMGHIIKPNVTLGDISLSFISLRSLLFTAKSKNPYLTFAPDLWCSGFPSGWVMQNREVLRDGETLRWVTGFVDRKTMVKMNVSHLETHLGGVQTLVALLPHTTALQERALQRCFSLISGFQLFLCSGAQECCLGFLRPHFVPSLTLVVSINCKNCLLVSRSLMLLSQMSNSAGCRWVRAGDDRACSSLSLLGVGNCRWVYRP